MGGPPFELLRTHKKRVGNFPTLIEIRCEALIVQMYPDIALIMRLYGFFYELHPTHALGNGRKFRLVKGVSVNSLCHSLIDVPHGIEDPFWMPRWNFTSLKRERTIIRMPRF